VEQNFRNLNRAVRERIATWEGGKATLLEEIFGERDTIADSERSETRDEGTPSFGYGSTRGAR